MCTFGKYKYFLTIIDDFSRATWVHLLKMKSESLEILKCSAFVLRNNLTKV